MDYEFSELIGYAVLLILAFLVLAAITRAVFAIGRFLKIQRSALRILMEMAKQQGVPEEKLKAINTYAES